MKAIISLFLILFLSHAGFTQSPIGKWKKISHTTIYEGKEMDSHRALLTQRPCAANIVWEVNADGSFRLKAADSGCDQQYISIQERLYAKTKWKLEGDKFMVSATNFAVSQTYQVRFSKDLMIMTGTEGQGVITYKRL